jgi:hypothetical protein
MSLCVLSLEGDVGAEWRGLRKFPELNQAWGFRLEDTDEVKHLIDELKKYGKLPGPGFNW